MKKLTFRKVHNNRRKFQFLNKRKDTTLLDGNNCVLLSAPHAVPQTRNGLFKVAEIGSITCALAVKQKTNSFLIAKTENNFDDANFDEICIYKDMLYETVKNNNIKYVIDFHGLSKDIEMDVNLGTNLGTNIESNVEAYDKLVEMLTKGGFSVSVDNPFNGGNNTISAYTKRSFQNVFSIQVEINCGITNDFENWEKFSKLIDCFSSWIENLK